MGNFEVDILIYFNDKTVIFGVQLENNNFHSVKNESGVERVCMVFAF